MGATTPSNMGDTEFDSFFDEPAAGDDAMFADPLVSEFAQEPEASCDDSMQGFEEPAPFAAAAPAPDMSAAFVTTQNLSDDSPALSAWRAENQIKLSERAAQSATDLAKLNQDAAAARSLFYEQRKIETSAACKANSEEEAMSKQAKAELAQKDNLWESVTDMIDLQAKGDGKDVARMRSVMISMKNA